jgi:Major Facilitator Superfamily
MPRRESSDEVGQQQHPQSHTQSTLALCLAVFSVSYMLISVFPYSGFMVIQLLPAGELNEENVGFYAGLMATSFMVGRTISSYGWGKAADVYGRVPCLSLSLLLSCLLSLGFGLSTTFVGALSWRFWLGVANGVLPISKTAVSELAFGDSKLETRGMGLVMGMWGWGFLISPGISGITAEPVKQYPDVAWLQNDQSQWYYVVLQKFPFLLPNLIGSVLGFLALIAVILCVTETLPKQHVKPLHEIPSRLWFSLKRVLSVIPEESSSFTDESTAFLSTTSDPSSSNLLADDKRKKYGSTRSECGEEDFENSDEMCLLQLDDSAFAELDDDVEDAVSKAQASYDELSFMLSTTRNSRQSISSSVRMHSTVLSQRRRQSRLSAWKTSMRLSLSSSLEPTATMTSLWSQRNTRNHMIVFWLASFVSTTVDEGFPLFCISKAGGLALSEKSIGKVLSMCGLIFAISQYFVFASLVSRFGLYGSIQISSAIMGPMIALVPLSLWLNRRNVDEVVEGEETDYIKKSTFIFLR